MPAPLHPHEVERLDSLRRHALLDMTPDNRFDRLIFMAAQILRVRIAIIGVIDENHQWFKAAVGTSNKRTSRDEAFCAHTILGQGIMIVEDTRNDLRFVDHPAVTGPPFIRFYAGVPLHSRDGLPLSTLCAIDTQPRALTIEQRHSLLLLGREAEELVRSMDIG